MEITFRKKEKQLDFSKSESYLKRQQDIDALLILAKVLDLPLDTDAVTKLKAKIYTLIDKI